MGTVGNACAGVYGNLEVVLPPNTYLYVTQQFPVYCYQTNSQGQTTRNTANCPQSLSTGTYGYRLNPVNSSAAMWPLPIGASIEVQVPVYSTATMSGIATSSYLTGAVQAVNGAGNPWDNPKVGVFVAANPPTISYPTPSATSITNTTARTTAYVNNHFTSGNVYFDIGTTTSYGSSQGPGAVPNTWDSGTFYVDWSALTPGTTYHWRMRFVHAGGTTYGADQTFTTTGTAPVGSVKGDFTADGKTDIVLRNYSSGQNAVWVMNGTALTSTVDLPALPNLNFRIEGTNDFSADGKNDLVLRNYSTGANALWVMNGTSLSTIVDLPALPNLNFRFEGTGDFNVDGKNDIILRNYSNGQNAVWLMNGTSLSTITDLPTLPNLSMRIEGAGDFNADGKNDIVLRNYATGQNAVWIMNGTTLSSVVDLPTLPNLNYRIDGVGDMNADGKPDIILRNYSTGQNAVWIMNGTTLSSTQDLPTLPNLNYEINGPR
jgi:hypothetical protein